MSDICLSILHFNDFHGHIENAPKLATLINQARATDKRDNCSTLLLNGGDLISGTYISYKFKGKAEFQFLKALGTKAMVLGNHDFDFGQAELSQNIKGSALTTLSANVYLCKNDVCKNILPSHTYVQLASLKIAIFGLTSSDTPAMSLPQNVAGLKFESTSKAAAHALQQVAGKSDIQIALTHIGVKEDILLAKRFPQIDAVIGGHDHVPGSQHCRNVLTTPVCQSPSNGRSLGWVRLNIKNNRVVGSKAQILPVTDSTMPDPVISKLLAKLATSAKKDASRVATVRKTETTKFGAAKEVAGIMRKATKASFAFINNSGVRGGLPAGKITFGMIFEMFPFDNYLVAGNMLGKDIRLLLEKSIAKASRGDSTSLTFSGISYVLKDGNIKPTNISIDGKPLDEKAYYVGATIDFLTFGAIGYTELPHTFKLIKKSGLLRDYVSRYIGK